MKNFLTKKQNETMSTLRSLQSIKLNGQRAKGSNSERALSHYDMSYVTIR